MADDKAKATLRRVAEQLLSMANKDNAEKDSVPSGSTPVTTSIAQEHRRVFNYQPRVSFQPSNYSRPSKKGKGKTQSCTIKLVCLAKKDADKPPSAVYEKTSVSNLGLGPGSICLDVNSPNIHDSLVERYPLLEVAGGYELLLYQRGGLEQGFHSIPPPYTPAKIKELAGQAQVYVRPLQRDLDNLEQGMQDYSTTEKISGPVVKCMQCEKNIPMHEFRSHAEEKHKARKRSNSLVILDEFIESDGEKQRKTSSASQKVDNLKELFPDWEEATLERLLSIHGTPDAVALLISTLNKPQETGTEEPSDNPEPDDTELMKSPFADPPVTLKSLLRELRSNLSNEKVKLKVDQEDLINDAMAFYKDPDFNPRQRLRVIFNKQPAADTGGVTRQFFTQLLNMISSEFFQGEEYKQPIYNANMVACGIMKLCGTIVVHSILLGGPGFPIFSPGVYHYLATGDIDKAVEHVTIEDCSLGVKSFVKMVAGARDVATVDQDAVIQMLSECGITKLLTNDNKINVIHSVMLHDAISRPKILLDQFREGLSILGFSNQLKKHPDIFRQLFVRDDASINYDEVLQCLCFPSAMDEDEASTRNFLKEFLQKASKETLSNFLTFATGAPCLPNFGLGKIEVKFESSESIFASTCLQHVTFPKQFPDQATFCVAMDSVLNTVAKSFTNV